MKRDLKKTIENWSFSPRRKPLILKGARQVGKTWLVRELGKKFDSYIELNFEEDPHLDIFFQKKLDPQNLLIDLQNYLGQKIIPGKTLLFMDEIQCSPQAITSLRYFYEKLPELHVIAAGSLLEFELQKLGLPVGRVQLLHLFPLNFGEFLSALGKESLRESLIHQNQEPLPKPLHDQLLTLIRDYCLVGGMPEVVEHYRKNFDFHACQQILSEILNTFRRDFSKYAKKHQIKYVRMTFDQIPLQLGQKLKFSNLSREIKSAELSEALDLLEMAGLVYKIYHTSANGIPLGAEVNPKKFKVLFFDMGLTQKLLNLDLKILMINPDIIQINKGTLAELFVGLELIAYLPPQEIHGLYYWHRESRASNAEVDYVIAKGVEIYPLEVKSGSTGHLKSLHLFLEEKKIKTGVKISSQSYFQQDHLINLPFYFLEAWIKP